MHWLTVAGTCVIVSTTNERISNFWVDLPILMAICMIPRYSSLLVLVAFYKEQCTENIQKHWFSLSVYPNQNINISWNQQKRHPRRPHHDSLPLFPKISLHNSFAPHAPLEPRGLRREQARQAAALGAGGGPGGPGGLWEWVMKLRNGGINQL